MYINQIFELSMVLEHEKFHKILNQAHKKADYLEQKDGEYIDLSIASKEMTEKYRDSRYKKKVKLIINVGLITDSGKLIRISSLGNLLRGSVNILIINTGLYYCPSC